MAAELPALGLGGQGPQAAQLGQVLRSGVRAPLQVACCFGGPCCLLPARLAFPAGPSPLAAPAAPLRPLLEGEEC